MNVQRRNDQLILELGPVEVRMLRRALERASFIDTPVTEQADIIAFCARALERLPPDA